MNTPSYTQNNKIGRGYSIESFDYLCIKLEQLSCLADILCDDISAGNGLQHENCLFLLRDQIEALDKDFSKLAINP
jgi:hypothetical protein